MLFKADAQKQIVRKEVFGGKGDVDGYYAVPRGESPEGSRFLMIGRMVLNPGVTLGLHAHEKDEETYMILSGRGIYTDNDEKEYEVGPGDVTLTLRGQKHCIRCSGDEPLVMAAVVAG